jgi:hypothetical protein
MVGKAGEFFGIFEDPLLVAWQNIYKRFSLVMAIEIRQAKIRTFIQRLAL